MPFHDHNQDRHGRMFELLRQTQLAETTEKRLDADARNLAETAIALKLQKRALQSLRCPEAAETRVRSAFHR